MIIIIPILNNSLGLSTIIIIITLLNTFLGLNTIIIIIPLVNNSLGLSYNSFTPKPNLRLEVCLPRRFQV